MTPCVIDDCMNRPHARGMCNKHYLRWLWTACCTPAGYGQFGVAGRIVMAHRWLYEQLVGPIPDGMQLDHMCRVRPCVNPDHLEVVTQLENIMRGVSVGALLARRKECMRGHPYTTANSYVGPTGARSCRVCARLRKAEARAA